MAGRRATEKQIRRRPARGSSQQIIEAILEATTQLLGELGVAGLTTNRIAERAGVSIGSLYRYFPDKETIVAEIDLRLRRAAAERFVGSLAGFTTDLPGSVVAALQAFMDSRGPALELRRTLMRDVPISWIAKNVAAVWEFVVPAAAQALQRLQPSLSQQAAELRVFLALHAIQGVTTGNVLWPLAAGTRRDEVQAELARWLTRYLLNGSDP